MTDDVAQPKTKAPTPWYQRAASVDGKPWCYVPISHDAIDADVTFRSLIRRYRFRLPNSN